MVDYARLANTAKEIQDADRIAFEKHKRLRPDPCLFFGRVRDSLIEEMKKANEELRKKRAALLDQNHLPGFSEEMFLTYGTDSLCRVGLGIIRGGCKITAIISGPPNGYEISRKEFLCSQDANCREAIHVVKAGSKKAASRPDEIAAEIIAGILQGKFK
jgi:hypothetical protein